MHHLRQISSCRFEQGRQTYLLHGDLHHENMFCDAEGKWIAIDPKEVMGARLSEYERFMQNFVADEPKPLLEVICERAGMLAGEHSAGKFLGIGFIDLILSCAWSVNAGGTLAPERRYLIKSYADIVTAI